MSEEEKNTLAFLPPLKRAKYFKKLMDEENLTASKIAQRFQKSLAFVSNTLRLLKLPEFVQEGLLSGEISEGHARALIMIADHQAMVKIYRKILLEKASVRQTETLAREVKNKSKN